jgi:hypothetical protein
MDLTRLGLALEVNGCRMVETGALSEEENLRYTVFESGVVEVN